jgi:hypothetical protein
MSAEHWWSDTDWGETEGLELNPFPEPLGHLQISTWTELGAPSGQAGDKPPSGLYVYTLVVVQFPLHSKCNASAIRRLPI